MHLGRLSGFFPSDFPTKILYAFLISVMRAPICPAHVVLLLVNQFVLIV